MCVDTRAVGSVDDRNLIIKKIVDTLDGKRYAAGRVERMAHYQRTDSGDHSLADWLDGDQGDTRNTLTEIDALIVKIGVAETELKGA